MTTTGHTQSNNRYNWLHDLPLHKVKQSLGALPAPIFDALRERVFVAAVKAGDINIVSIMLSIQIEPHERIMLELSRPSPMYPLEYAVATSQYTLAKTLLQHMCRGATRPPADKLLEQVLQVNTVRSWSGKPPQASLKE
jgi:hypothetical protein